MNAEIIGLQNATTLSRAGEPQTGKTELEKTDFLRMLMTQLSNQDPTDPMDSEAFTQQLTQFSSLEALTNLGDKMDQLLQVTSSSNAANAVSLLEREVRVAGNEFKGPEATVNYDLPSRAKSANLVIRDKDNKVVKILEDMKIDEGSHEVKIDGLEEGKDYKFFIEAKNAQGAEVEASLSVVEYVEAINFAGPVPMLLTSSGRTVSAADVLEIRKKIAASGELPAVTGETFVPPVIESTESESDSTEKNPIFDPQNISAS